MGLLTNICDQVAYTGIYSSSTSFYTTTDPVVYYVVPLVTGHSYRISFTEAHNRRRIVTTSFNPSVTTGTGVRCLLETNDPAVPYELDFVAKTSENYLYLYVSNIDQRPFVGVYDLSVPDYAIYYLVHDLITSKYYANVEGSLTEVAITSSPTRQDFIDYGGLIPTSGMLDTLTKFELLKCADTVENPEDMSGIKYSIIGNVKPRLFVCSAPVKVTEQYQTGFKSVSFEITKADTTVIKVLLSQDGSTWMRYNAPVTQEVTGDDGVVSEEVVTPGSWANVDFTVKAALTDGMTLEELVCVDEDAFNLIYTEDVAKELYIAFIIQCSALDHWCVSNIRVELMTTK